jgi:hypothetical protein
MKVISLIGWTVAGVLSLVLMLSLAFGLEWAGIKWYGYFGPKKEAVRREVFKETRSYNEGKEQELVKLRMEYLLAKDENAKRALASTIRHLFADYDESLIDSAELRAFLKQIKYSTVLP